MHRFVSISSKILLLLILNNAVLAQSGHYWAQQYGNKSTLLNGSVIGSADDLGAVFYNPARIALLENPSILLSADVYQWSRFRVKDGFGDSRDFLNDNIASIPSMVAGTFKVGFLKNHRFAYALLPRNEQVMNVNYSYSNFGELIDSFPGEEIFDGSISISDESKEQWHCFTWSYSPSGKWSIGLTSILSNYSVSKSNSLALQAFTANQETAIYRFGRSIQLNKYGLMWKLGIAAELEKILFGATITTPFVGLGFRERGQFGLDELYSGVSQSTGDLPDTYTRNNQSGLDVTYRRPWSIGAGFGIPVNKLLIHFSGEWYSTVPGYTMMQTASIISQSSGEETTFVLVDDFGSIANVGVGLELNAFESVSFFSGFNSDFSAVKDRKIGFIQNEPSASNSTITADLYHFSFGSSLALSMVQLTLGGSYTGSKQEILRPVNFPDSSEDPILNAQETGVLQWDRWRLIFSVSIPFFDTYRDKIIDKLDNL